MLAIQSNPSRPYHRWLPGLRLFVSDLALPPVQVQTHEIALCLRKGHAAEGFRASSGYEFPESHRRSTHIADDSVFRASSSKNRSSRLSEKRTVCPSERSAERAALTLSTPTMKSFAPLFWLALMAGRARDAPLKVTTRRLNRDQQNATAASMVMPSPILTASPLTHISNDRGIRATWVPIGVQVPVGLNETQWKSLRQFRELFVRLVKRSMARIGSDWG